MDIEISYFERKITIAIIKYLIMVYDGEGSVDDIDHLGNAALEVWENY